MTVRQRSGRDGVAGDAVRVRVHGDLPFDHEALVAVLGERFSFVDDDSADLHVVCEPAPDAHQWWSGDVVVLHAAPPSAATVVDELARGADRVLIGASAGAVGAHLRRLARQRSALRRHQPPEQPSRRESAIA